MPGKKLPAFLKGKAKPKGKPTKGKKLPKGGKTLFGTNKAGQRTVAQRG